MEVARESPPVAPELESWADGFGRPARTRLPRLAHRVVGVDIGSERLKLVELTRSRSGPLLSAAVLAPTPSSAVSGDGEVDPEVLGPELRRLLDGHGFQARRAWLAMPAAAVVLRSLAFPALEEQELREVIRWETERYVPGSPDEFVVDFCPLPSEPAAAVTAGGADEEPATTRVLFVAARRQAVGRRLDALRRSGLTGWRVDVDLLAALRPVRFRGAEVIADVGATSTRLVLLMEGAPALVRVVPVGMRRLVLGVSERLGVPADEAERLIRHHGVKSGGGRVLQAVAPDLQELTAGVRAAAEAFAETAGTRAAAGGSGEGSLVIGGGGAHLPGLPEALLRAMGPLGRRLSPETFTPASYLRATPEAERQLGLMGPEFMVAVGLALLGGDVLW